MFNCKKNKMISLMFQKNYKIILKNFIRKFTDKFYQNKKCISFEKYQNYHIYPNILKEPLIYSGGVGKDISFELELIKRYNAKIFLFDPSPTGIETMKKIKNKNIHFYPIGLARYSKKETFGEPDNKEEGSYRFSKNGMLYPCTSLSDFMKKQNHKKIDLLKIDIEGFEYGVIEDIYRNKIYIEQIVLEFHGWMKNAFKKQEIIAKKKLKKMGYKLAYKRNDDYTYVLNKLL